MNMKARKVAWLNRFWTWEQTHCGHAEAHLLFSYIHRLSFLRCVYICVWLYAVPTHSFDGMAVILPLFDAVKKKKRNDVMKWSRLNSIINYRKFWQGHNFLFCFMTILKAFEPTYSTKLHGKNLRATTFIISIILIHAHKSCLCTRRHR